ncbi:hypothetical protein [Liquorilactobacillus sicerae]|uniref:hypothetical protein n=1 Tax=Liquorilactobacillus sicerae TaxID=1416943 RepID=UPI00247FE432|nr:hypothetical protein [Liquorilactobacillus sicerae]
MTRSNELRRVLKWAMIVILINVIAMIFPNVIVKSIVTIATLYCSYKAINIKYRI